MMSDDASTRSAPGGYLLAAVARACSQQDGSRAHSRFGEAARISAGCEADSPSQAGVKGGGGGVGGVVWAMLVGGIGKRAVWVFGLRWKGKKRMGKLEKAERKRHFRTLPHSLTHRGSPAVLLASSNG